MVSINVAHITKQVMSPNLQCMYDYSKFKIMCWIVNLVLSQLTRGISNDSSFLHKHTTQSSFQCIAKHIKRFVYV